VVPFAITGIFRQVQRQRTLRPEQTKEPVRQARRPVALWRGEARNGGGWKGQLGLLPQPQTVLARATAFAEARGLGKMRLQQPQGLKNVMLFRRRGQPAI